MQVTIGGDRVGSGRKMKAHLHNYFRSTHNLSEKFASSMGSGILYPCLCKLAMRGDSFDIDIAADCRTIPTQGPLFGSYKMQVDIYQVPVRLYQGILHNNPLSIGLNMSQVMFPMLRIGTKMDTGKSYGKMNDSCLLKYLGLSGIGTKGNDRDMIYARKINALPALGYYDIFKNYYANKQEDKAYVISAITQAEVIGFHDSFRYRDKNGTWNDMYFGEIEQMTINAVNFANNQNVVFEFEFDSILTLAQFYDEAIINVTIGTGSDEQDEDIDVNNGNTTISGSSWETTILDGLRVKVMHADTGRVNRYGAAIYKYQVLIINQIEGNIPNITFRINRLTDEINRYNPLSIVPFDLSNIDDMRYDLLSHNRLGDTFIIEKTEGDNNAYLPYSTLVERDNNEHTLNNYPLNGLVLKTYQNDIYNNWLNSEQIEGEGSIQELTKVDVTEGAFSMDALSFAEKLYNMLNRIAIAGNTYEDWQDVVYEEAKRRQIESPIFLGGMSQEVMFDEIVQNAPATVDGKTSPLGTLGGRGRLIHESKKGGKIHVKVDEASFIMGIVSLTPRTFYSQGNEFYMTDITTMDDLHKPAMDGIGFQDLIGERMAWWDTKIKAYPSGSQISYEIERSKIGKLPAWIEYMTSVDKCYGDFAGEYGDKAGFMVLNRNYEYDEETGGIKDATTYVDPSKYNYAFADVSLEAQNFWVEIAFDIKARRLMSAKLIPSV